MRWVKRLLAALAAALAAIIWRDAARTRRDAEALEHLWTVVDGRRVHARRAGPHPPGCTPVVLVHGYAVSSLYYIPLAARLGRELPVYAVDLPGFGQSDEPPRVLDIPELADALLAWMDAVGIGRAELVGNSLGCTILAEVGARHPERVGRLVLVAPTVEPSARSIGKQLLRLLHDATRERPSLTFLQAADWLRFGPLRLYRLARYAIADRIEDKLPRVAAPTLVVCGERDTVVSRSWAEEVARLLPHGRLAVLPHAPHAINYSAPEPLAALVLSFLHAPAQSTAGSMQSLKGTADSAD